MHTSNLDAIKLSEPHVDGQVSVERALAARRSVRRFKNGSLNLVEVSQLLWSAQGVSNSRGYRTAPSAGALYPLEIYLAAGRIDELAAGIYKYMIAGHALRKIADGDRRADLSQAALNQNSITKAPVVLLFCTVNERVTCKYGDRGMRYIFMEIGHAAQNVCLQAVALGMGTVVIGAFRDNEVKMVAHLADNERPAYIIPIGR
jgi:SagB-type dehydrogenase family enzyme